MRDLIQSLASQDAAARIITNLDNGVPASIDGVWGGFRACLATAIRQRATRPLVIVSPRADAIDDWLDDLAFFSNEPAKAFPAIEAFEGEHLAHDDLFGQRLRLLKAVDAGQSIPLIATSIQALLQPVPGRHELLERTRHLRPGDEMPREELTRWLVENHYHPTTAVELPNEFSVRGGVIDVFAADWPAPVRIELFGDEVDSLREFDIGTQRSIRELERIELTTLPIRGGYQSHLADHLPQETLFVLIEPRELEQQGRRYLERLEHPQEAHSVTSVLKRLMQSPAVAMTELAESADANAWAPHIESVEQFTGTVDAVREAVAEINPEQNVFLACQTSAEAKRLQELFAGTPVHEQGRLHYPIGRLSTGFRYPEAGLIVLSAGELFQRQDIRRTPSRHLGRAIDTFLDLRKGDLVVHLVHGLGRYRGIERLEKNGQTEEHVVIEFADEAKVFVPVTKIDLVQKYVGGGKARPRLAKLGGKTWAKRKEIVEKAVLDLAADMLELQATREQRPGIAYPNDTIWQSEFDASFPYEETPDQFSAIEAIKEDMERSRPMDRLICGDVGFGKTEIAMRAAFKAVDAGYQVAILVPTTVLAEQHYRSFRDRMAEFPFNIATLSRFGTKKQQSQTLEQLAEGQVDIVIGTHRLAQHDVRFQNLGLVVIDEEQRFGVEVKERLKTLRQIVDVLTMTATPIPRTLHMSLLGIRDISNLAIAPEDRFAVETRVTRFNDELVRHAIMRELNRNGQVFFVHNRVRDIERVRDRLLRLVPEARIEIGHAQMPEHDLERVMLGFVRHEFDVLLSTTIVESGLDIPNANTIFIDEAERFGLSDLHQLRGRVGRYKHQAYCYLLINPAKSLTPVAARRLRAIEEFSDLGAGFALAMRDLEIRGAGNILGTQQSGHIALVGYELYCQLLENAVRHLRREPPKEMIDVEINLPGDAYFPEEYAGGLRTKIDLYRRLARTRTQQEIDQFREELDDRFGTPPAMAERLLRLAEMRLLAHAQGIGAIRVEEGRLVFEHASRNAMERQVLAARGRLRIIDDHTACSDLPVEQEEPAMVLKLVESLLRRSG